MEGPIPATLAATRKNVRQDGETTADLLEQLNAFPEKQPLEILSSTRCCRKLNCASAHNTRAGGDNGPGPHAYVRYWVAFWCIAIPKN